MSWLEKFQTQRIEELQFKIDQLETEARNENKSVAANKSNQSEFSSKTERKAEQIENDEEPDWMKNFEETQALK